MAFEYGEQKDKDGNIIHQGSWGVDSTPKDAFTAVIENFRVLRDDGVSVKPDEETMKQYTLACNKYTDDLVSAIKNNVPLSLSTLYDIASAIGNDRAFSKTIRKEIEVKANKATTYTKTEVDAKLKTTNDSLSGELTNIGIALRRDMYTKAETKEKIDTAVSSISKTACTEAEVDAKIAEAKASITSEQNTGTAITALSGIQQSGLYKGQDIVGAPEAGLWYYSTLVDGAAFRNIVAYSTTNNRVYRGYYKGEAWSGWTGSWIE